MSRIGIISHHAMRQSVRPSVITLQSFCWYVSQSIRLGNHGLAKKMFDSDYSFVLLCDALWQFKGQFVPPIAPHL
jgi:hypothetical protein